MMRKSVVSCSLILLACLAFKMFGYSYSTAFNQDNNSAFEDYKTKVLNVEEEVKDEVEDLFDFANEIVPLTGNSNIEERMNRALKANSYSRLKTHKLHKRAEKWFPIIEPILAKYGIPEDFKYIPLVETGMEQGLTSHKGASGMWQFMPQTARSYGLKVNADVDQRQNVRLSTIAAAKYLRDLHKVFKSWTLVAAAYNVGEGSLSRSINRQNEDNYYRLKLNKETSRYVYSLVSMKEIMENPQKYGYKVTSPRKLVAYHIQ